MLRSGGNQKIRPHCTAEYQLRQQLNITFVQFGVDAAAEAANVVKVVPSESALSFADILMRLAGIAPKLTIAAVLLVLSGSSIHAQQQRDNGSAGVAASAPISSAVMDNFVAANSAIAEFRGKVQGELAEPRSKKPETQEMLRAKLHDGTERLLKEHHLTEAEFTALTRRVSTDDVVRKQFEEATARLPKR